MCPGPSESRAQGFPISSLRAEKAESFVKAESFTFLGKILLLNLSTGSLEYFSNKSNC